MTKHLGPSLLLYIGAACMLIGPEPGQEASLPGGTLYRWDKIDDDDSENALPFGTTALRQISPCVAVDSSSETA